MEKLTGKALVEAVKADVAAGMSVKDSCAKYQCHISTYYGLIKRMAAAKTNHQTIVIGEKSDFAKLRLLVQMVTDEIERLEK